VGTIQSAELAEGYLVSFQVHYILNELVMGGMVLETNMTEIFTRVDQQNKLERQEVMVKY